MKRLLTIAICCICFMLPSLSAAESRTVSWDPVTTYTDNTPIESNKIVTYISYWTIDNTLTLSSLHAIGVASTSVSATFDPGLQGMIRGSTVYFTAKAMLNTGEESALAPAFSWIVPAIPPSVPGKSTLDSVILSK